MHNPGRQARKALEDAKTQIADLLGASSNQDILITSGATEANNLALKGMAYGLKDRGRHLVTSQIEHSALLEPCAWLETQGWEVTYVPVDGDGRVSPQAVAKALRPDTVLVSIMHGNNEIGTLQPIEALGNLVRSHGIFFHTDAVQTVGKLPIDLSQWPVDLLSCSAHKLYGPKGVGFLYANAQAREVLTPWIHGGSQQTGLRPGTENPAAVIGMASALALSETERESATEHIYALQEKLIAGIQAHLPNAVLNGPRNVRERVPGNVNFTFAPVQGEALVLRLDMADIAASSGSACHAGQIQGSHVIEALLRGQPDAAEIAKCSLRLSIGHSTLESDIDIILDKLPVILEKTGFNK